MESFSSWASKSDRPAWPSIWPGERGPPSQGWKTFLHNHTDRIVAMDLFVVPTISFRLLYGLLIMGHGRRQILWFGVTAHPTAEWLSNQITEACGWEQAPRYLIRDRDGPTAESSSEDIDQWAFAIDRHLRHVLVSLSLSRRRGGRPTVPLEICKAIREMRASPIRCGKAKK